MSPHLTDEQRLRFIQATARALQPSLRSEPLPAQEHKALCYDLQAITEAAADLGQAVRDRHPDFPWETSERFRNHLAHNHITASPAAVALAAHTLVPALDRLATNELSLAATQRRRQQRAASVGLQL